jgi:hypothetical protein
VVEEEVGRVVLDQLELLLEEQEELRVQAQQRQIVDKEGQVLLRQQEGWQNLVVPEVEDVVQCRLILLEVVQFTEEAPEVLEEVRQLEMLWLMERPEERQDHIPLEEVGHLEQVGFHQHQVLQVQMEHLNFVDMEAEEGVQQLLQILQELLVVTEEVLVEEEVAEERLQIQVLVVLED